MSVQTLIDNAESRANAYATATEVLVAELRTFLIDRNSNLYLPGSIDEDGNYITGLDLTHVALPSYEAPIKDETAMPVYVPPLTPLPTAPALADIASVTLPAAREEPDIDTSGLFAQVTPSSNMPEFNESDPDLNIDELIAEMSAIAAPVLQSIEIPALTPLTLRVTPQIDIPGFVDVLPPDELDTPVDYAASMEASYRQMLPEMQSFIDDKVATWVSQYAPEYNEWNSLMQSKI
jgi:hypothetical protein